MWRRLRLLPFAVLLGGVGLAACTVPSSIRLDRVDYSSQFAQNGPHESMSFYWSGSPVFPVTIKTHPTRDCSRPNLTCGPATFTWKSEANPLVWKDIEQCSGNAPASLPPWRISYDVTLTDAAGHSSPPVRLNTYCYFHPVPFRITSLVLHDQPWLTQALRPVTAVSWKLLDVSRSVVLALSLVLLIAFPSQLFNSTLQAHYAEVMAWFSRIRPLGGLFASLRTRLAQSDAGSPPWLLAGVFVLGGLFGSLLDPRWGFDLATLEALLGILLASAFTTAVYTWVHAEYLRRALRLSGRFRVYGGGILVALCCVLVSRLTNAEPGYLYGVLLGYTLGAGAPELARHHQGRNVALGAGATLVVSVAVWLLWTPVKVAADSTDAFPLMVLSTAMASVFVGGMTALLFGLLPLRWLDGEKLLAWQRLVWALLVVIGMFLFVHVVLNNAAGTPHSGRNLAVTVVLFIAFGAVSVGLWAYFRFRPQPAVAPSTA